jgi:hypothetical protein
MDDLENLTSLERRWLKSRYELLRNRDSWVMGTFAEYVVADALGDEVAFAPSSFSPWDLLWKGKKI